MGAVRLLQIALYNLIYSKETIVCMNLIWSIAHCLVMFSSTKGVSPVGGDGDLLALRTVVIGLSRKYLNLKSFMYFCLIIFNRFWFVSSYVVHKMLRCPPPHTAI